MSSAPDRIGAGRARSSTLRARARRLLLAATAAAATAGTLAIGVSGAGAQGPEDVLPAVQGALEGTNEILGGLLALGGALLGIG